jgi:hypothetical protein
MKEKYDEQRHQPVIAMRRNRATRPGEDGPTSVAETLVGENPLGASSGDATTVSTILTRHIAHLEAELREAKSKLQAAEVERDNERARAAELAVKLAQVDAMNAVLLQTQSRAGASRQAQWHQTNYTPSTSGAPCAVAPYGTLLTIANLPGPETRRWVPSRKAIVVAAVRVGMLSVEEACGRYRLTEEELAMWQFQVERHGLAGLRTSKGQLYRPDPTRRTITFDAAMLDNFLTRKIHGGWRAWRKLLTWPRIWLPRACPQLGLLGRGHFWFRGGQR